MTNAFNWQGKPSIFTAGVKQKNFGEAQTRKNLNTSLRAKPSPTALEGSSKYLAPDMMLARNPRRSSK